MKKTAKKKTTSNKVNGKTATPTPSVNEKNKLWRYMTKKPENIEHTNNKEDNPEDNHLSLKMKTTLANSEDNPEQQVGKTSQEDQDIAKLTFTTRSDKPGVTEKIRRFQTMSDVCGGGRV